MADLGETIRLVELTCARLCHDLGGLIGTVSNALDMVAEDNTSSDEVLAFGTSAAKALMLRLRLMRSALGPESGALSLRALRDLAAPPLQARRIDLDTSDLPTDGVFAPAAARVVLNLLVLAADCLPKSGAVVLVGDPADLFVRIDGPGAAWPPGLAACLRDEAAAFAALTSARSAQMALTTLFALHRNLRLSAVLGAGGGIAALRLGPA